MIYMSIMQDDSEIISYDQEGIPLRIQAAKLSDYPEKQALCHWHDDIEFLYILNGKMNYYVNGKRILLDENDCIMINARQMHYGYSFQNQDCNFVCFLFHPQLLTGNSKLFQTYIAPILKNQSLEYVHYRSKENSTLEMDQFLRKLIVLKDQQSPAYQIEVIGWLHIFLSKLSQHSELIPPMTPEDSNDLSIQKNMVSYIYQNYTDKLSLSDIAASGNVCRSKCCLIFKHYLQQSPIEFLNSYRLKISARLLVNTSRPITQIAFSCGFNHLSYYSKLFLRTYGCTPSEYRSQHRSFPSSN